nr:IS110 family transposase [Sphingomonas turrisvirgatae]
MAKKITNPALSAMREAAEVEPARARVWIGLDVGMKSTSVCVLDGDGQIVHQCSMKTSATELGRYLAKNFASNVARIGLESGAMGGHLAVGLRRLGYQVSVLDALQVHRVLSIRRNKTDTNDARGIAEITRSGRDYLTEVYVKSAACFEVRAQIILRHRLVQQRVQTEAVVRGLLRVYGGRVESGAKSAATFRERVVEQLLIIVDNEGVDLRPRIMPILDHCARLQVDAARIDAELETLAGENPVCRRFMAIPGVGAITALSFFTAIEEPSRFRRMDDVAAYLGLTPRVYQSGESLTHGSISKMGNRLTRTHLVNAATVLLSATKTFSSLKDWGVRLAKKVGFNKARIAVARKLATIMFGIWRDGTHFQFKAETVVPHRQMMQAARS